MTRDLSARLLATALIVFASADHSAAADKKPKLDQALQKLVNQNGDGLLDVIIRAVPGGSGAVRAKLRSKGRDITGDYLSINAINATIDLRDLADFDNDPS